METVTGILAGEPERALVEVREYSPGQLGRPASATESMAPGDRKVGFV